MAAQIDLNGAFSGAIAAMDRHTRMEALYDALAHLSDSLSGIVSRPRMGEEGPGAEALEALDDFIMDQMDAVKNRALAVPPAEVTSSAEPTMPSVRRALMTTLLYAFSIRLESVNWVIRSKA